MAQKKDLSGQSYMMTDNPGQLAQESFQEIQDWGDRGLKATHKLRIQNAIYEKIQKIAETMIADATRSRRSSLDLWEAYSEVLEDAAQKIDQLKLDAKRKACEIRKAKTLRQLHEQERALYRSQLPWWKKIFSTEE